MARRNRRRNDSDIPTSELPIDLWTDNILPRLPVKNVFMCRAVNTSWRAAIDDPAFAARHFKLSQNNCEKNQLLTIEKLGLYGLDGCRLTVRRNDNLRKTDDIHRANGMFGFSVHCNGLFLVQDDYRRDLKVWNPSIRKSLTLPQCPLVACGGNIKYLFGFTPVRNDYVVYAFSAAFVRPYFDITDTKLASVAVYTVSDNRWRIKDNQMSLPGWLFSPFRKVLCDEKCVFVDGTVYWLRKDIIDYCHSHLIKKPSLASFNFDTEEFNFLDLPDWQPTYFNSTFRFLFPAGEKHLGLLTVSYMMVTVWYLKDGSWEKSALGRVSSEGFRYMWDHPHGISDFFFLGRDDITFIYGKVAYNITTEVINPVMRSLTPRVFLDTYVENMVLHRGCDGQVLTPLPTAY